MRLFPVLCLTLLPALLRAEEIDFTTMERAKDSFAGAKIEKDKAVLSSHDWAYLRTKEAYSRGAFWLRFVIKEPAKQANFFGEGWSAWPDPTFSDKGFELGVLLRASEKAG